MSTRTWNHHPGKQSPMSTTTPARHACHSAPRLATSPAVTSTPIGGPR
jgi:hypothetical protein